MSAEAETNVKYRDEYCCVPQCNGNARIHNELSFHHIPSEKKSVLRKQWIIAIRRDEGPFFEEMSTSKFGLPTKLKGTEKNLWVDFGRLATEHKALNLGQGFPDFMPPQHVMDALVTAATSDNIALNQYTRSQGHPRLVTALARLYSPLIAHAIDPMSEILISVGAYGSLFCAFQGLLNPGDEVILIEPFFDCYEPMVQVAGAVPRFVPLQPTSGKSTSSADWKFDPQQLESLFNDKTKLIVVNTPNNPLGKVYRKEELELIASLCIKYDVVCIADEVYEWLVYKPNRHIKIASLPGMWDRTLTIGSAGKTFNVTGWKLGWTVGPEQLILGMKTMHQMCNYTCPTILQEAIAESFEVEKDRLDSPDSFFQTLPAVLAPKRDKLGNMLQDFGMSPVMPEGGYFMIADISKFDTPISAEDELKDFKFVKWMTREKVISSLKTAHKLQKMSLNIFGEYDLTLTNHLEELVKLASIPISAFYSKQHKHLAENFIRFCFIKKDTTLQKAEGILKEWKSSLGQ